MNEERPVSREMAETSIADLERAMASGEEHIDIEVMGTKAVLERNDDGGFTMSVPGTMISSRLFPRATTAPSGYPDHVPFVEDEVVTISNPRDNYWVMVWLAPRMPEATHDCVSERSVLDGWLRGEDEEMPEVPIRRRSFEKGSLKRELMISRGIVSLVESPAEKLS